MILPWSVSVIYILFPGSATLLHTISTNLYFFSKLIEKVVLNQLDLQLSSNNILHPFQSVYPQYWISPSAHSYWSPLGWLWQLLYSHYTWPLSCLQQYWSLCSLWTPSTHFWHYQLCSLSYLSNRQQSGCGVPQGSVLDPILSILYTCPLSNIIQSQHINSQFFYADIT